MDDEDEPFVLPISEELDLHAFAPRDVVSVVEEYLRACRERGILPVRIVHGRGTGRAARGSEAPAGRLPGIVVDFARRAAGVGRMGRDVVRLAPLDRKL